MPRSEKITITNDARVPRLAAFPNGVTWYIYIRESDSGLYVQREFGGVRAAEVLVVKPVNWVEVVHDPDGGKAFVYFINDECLLRIEVTDSLETPSVQAYTRSATWYDAVSGGIGVGPYAGFTAPEIDPPTIALLPSPSTPSQRLMVIVRPNVALYRNARLAGFRLYRNEGLPIGWTFYGTVLYFGATPINAFVPITTTPTTRWYATSFRTSFGFAESAPSNIELDDGALKADVAPAGFGAGPYAGWSLTTKTPVKKSYGPDTTSMQGGVGPYTGWSLTDKVPIKRSYGPDTTSMQIGSGVGISWTANGFEIINP